MSAAAFPIGTRVQAVLADKGRTRLPGMTGAVVPESEWPGGFPSRWTEDNTIVVRWDRGSYGTFRPETAHMSLLALGADDDGTEAEAIAEVQIPHPGEIDEGPLVRSSSQAGLATLVATPSLVLLDAKDAVVTAALTWAERPSPDNTLDLRLALREYREVAR